MKSLNFSAFILAAVCAIAVQPKVYGQILPTETTDSGLGGGNLITGTVLVSNGVRMSRRITIRLQTTTRGDRITTTDERGNFAFRGLTSGDYTILIDKEKDFEPFAQAITILQVRGFPGQNYSMNIRLVPKANTQPKPGVLDAELTSLPERGKGLFDKAKELETVGDHPRAIEQLLLLTSEFPTFMMGFNELGVEYLRLNQLEKANAALQEAIKLQFDAFAPHMNRGIVLVNLKRYAEAEPVLREAKKLNEESGPVRYFLGTALANLGKFDEAEKDLSDAVSMGGSEMEEAHRILAIIYSSRGDKKRAAAELDTYLKLNPTAPDADQLKKVLAQLGGTPGQPATSKP
jgi:tetratricopeptide (TPR) repeat protein